MIKLHNGHEFTFCTASGALGYTGNGWWFEQLARLVGWIKPSEFTIITKTLTYEPRKGNYRWYAPWRCIRLLPDGGVINAVGLTNPGYEWWITTCYNYIVKKKRNIIVSIMPDNDIQLRTMIDRLNVLDDIKGIQLNLSCPNVKHNDSVDFICSMVFTAVKQSVHPVILKLSYENDYITICKEVDIPVELINTISWSSLHQQPSPLAKYGLIGGVSGKPIAHLAKQALIDVKMFGRQVISGGGIDSINEILEREALGAKAFAFGSIFIRHPSLPNRIMKEYYAKH